MGRQGARCRVTLYGASLEKNKPTNVSSIFMDGGVDMVRACGEEQTNEVGIAMTY